MAFFNAKAFWKYNPKKEVMENDKELKFRLDNMKMVYNRCI